MIDHIDKFFHDHLDFIQVAIVHTVAGFITLTDVNDALKTLGLLMALGFGLYKLIRFKNMQDKIDDILTKQGEIPTKYKWKIK